MVGYLARYIRRVGIANVRLLDVTEDWVALATSNGKTVTGHPVERLGRQAQHILPPGFHKVRHIRLYGSLLAGGRLEKARTIIGT